MICVDFLLGYYYRWCVFRDDFYFLGVEGRGYNEWILYYIILRNWFYVDNVIELKLDYDVVISLGFLLKDKIVNIFFVFFKL